MNKYENISRYLTKDELSLEQLKSLKILIDQKIKENSPPIQYTNCFYKYTNVDQRKLDLLKKKEIWFPAATTLNDPFDCRLNIKVDPQNKEHSVNEQKNCIEKVSNMVKGYGVLSLAAQIKGSENDGPNSLLTWAHYTDGHKGMCLCFDSSEYMKVEHDKDGFPIKNYEYFRPVVYTDEYPEMKPFMFLGSTKKDVIADTAFGMLMTKSKEWSYENEWRIIQKESNKGFPIPGKLKAVYFGMNISAENISKTLETIADFDNVDCFIGKKAEQEFKIEFVKIDDVSPQMFANIIQNSLNAKGMSVKVEAVLPNRIGVTVTKNGASSSIYYPFPAIYDVRTYATQLTQAIQIVIDNEDEYDKQYKRLNKFVEIATDF